MPSLRGGAGDFGKLHNDNAELRDENLAAHSKAHQAATNKYKQNRLSQQPDQHNQSHAAAGEPAEGDQQQRLPADQDAANLHAPLQLVSENQQLRERLAAQREQLEKTEDKLEKKRRFIKEMQGIQQDLTLIKINNNRNEPIAEGGAQDDENSAPEQNEQAQQVRQDGSVGGDGAPEAKMDGVRLLNQRYDEMTVENRVLKAKIGEMESQLNSMSTNFNTMPSTMPRSSLATASPTRLIEQRQGRGGDLQELREMRQIFEQRIAQLERENREREQAFTELRQGVELQRNQERNEVEAKDERIRQLENQVKQFGRRPSSNADVIGDMQELRQHTRLEGGHSYNYSINNTKFVPLRSHPPVKTLEYDDQQRAAASHVHQTNSDELFNFSQSQVQQEDVRGGMPSDQLYKSHFDQDSAAEYAHKQRGQLDPQQQDVDHSLKERTLPAEFDDDGDEEEDDCFSRDEAAQENFNANLRLKNSQVSRHIDPHVPAYGHGSHTKHPQQM